MPEDGIDSDDYLWRAYQLGDIVIEDGVVISYPSSGDKRSYDKFVDKHKE